MPETPAPTDPTHHLPSAVSVREVGLRDGLQSIDRILPTARKIEWLRREHAAGVREIEVGSFVPARLLPQMADTADVLAAAKTLPGLAASVLVPNLRGAERAIEAGADLLLVPLSASRAHSLANLRKTPDEVVAEMARIRAARDAAGSKLIIEGGVGTAFGCTLQGRVEPAEVLRLMQALLDAGADRVSLADTVGYADPAQVRRLFEAALRLAGERFCCGHFHDTRGLALANVYAALEVGVTRFDASLAGIGGCPYAPGASGNAATEDLAYMLGSMGCTTGVNLDALLALRADVAGWLEGETLHGTLWRAGLPKTYPDRIDEAGAAAPRETAPVAAAGAGTRVSAEAGASAGSVPTQAATPDAAAVPGPSGRAGPLPLAGIRVVEFSHMVMGPTCGMILADLGAEVIKVEPPEGDRTRRMSGLGVGFFRSFNRNKKSVVLDLHTPEGVASAKALIGTSDVMLENFRPGLMATLGLDYATLSRRFPRLVYVSHKGFLPGPYEHRLALDEVVQMMAGLAFMTGPVGQPSRAGASVNDIMGGMFGAIGVLAALWQRQRSGRGQEVQAALFENCAFLVASHMQQAAITGEPSRPMPARVSPWSVYDVFTLADGQLFIAAVSDKQWKQLCEVLERRDLLEDPALQDNAARVAVRPALLARLGEILGRHRVGELCAKLEVAGLPYAPITRPDELLDDPQLKAGGGLVTMQNDDGSQGDTVLLPLSLDGRRLGVRRPLPRIGEHTGDVLADLARRNPKQEHRDG